MKFFYRTQLRRFFEKENRKYYGLFTNGDLIKQISSEFWDLMLEYKDSIPDISSVYHLYITTVEKIIIMKPKLIDTFETKEDFVEATLCSSFIPMICGFKLYSLYKGQKAIDGGASKPIPYKYENSKKIFINVMPKICYSWPLVLN
jgi:hypothetical protein